MRPRRMVKSAARRGRRRHSSSRHCAAGNAIESNAAARRHFAPLQQGPFLAAPSMRPLAPGRQAAHLVVHARGAGYRAPVGHPGVCAGRDHPAASQRAMMPETGAGAGAAACIRCAPVDSMSTDLPGQKRPRSRMSEVFGRFQHRLRRRLPFDIAALVRRRGCTVTSRRVAHIQLPSSSLINRPADSTCTRPVRSAFFCASMRIRLWHAQVASPRSGCLPIDSTSIGFRPQKIEPKWRAGSRSSIVVAPIASPYS